MHANLKILLIFIAWTFSSTSPANTKKRTTKKIETILADETYELAEELDEQEEGHHPHEVVFHRLSHLDGYDYIYYADGSMDRVHLENKSYQKSFQWISYEEIQDCVDSICYEYFPYNFHYYSNGSIEGCDNYWQAFIFANPDYENFNPYSEASSEQEEFDHIYGALENAITDRPPMVDHGPRDPGLLNVYGVREKATHLMGAYAAELWLAQTQDQIAAREEELLYDAY